MAEYKITHHEPSIKDKIDNALGDHCLDGKVTGYSTVERTINESSENPADSVEDYAPKSSEDNKPSSNEYLPDLPSWEYKEKISHMRPGIGYSCRIFLAEIFKKIGYESLEKNLLNEANNIKSEFWKNKVSFYTLYNKHGAAGFIFEKFIKDYKAAALQYFIGDESQEAVRVCLENKDKKEAIKYLKLSGDYKKAKELESSL